MKKKFRFVFVLVACISLGYNGFSQLGIAYYASDFSKIGCSYNVNNTIRIEPRIYVSTAFEDFTPELVVCFNVVQREAHNIYVGIGGVANMLTGPVMPIGLQFYPIQNFKNFSLQVELQPTLDLGYDLILYGNGGFRYTFNKREK